MVKQTLLRISLPEGSRLYASEFRELLARQGKQSPELLHYEDGRPACGIPCVRMLGGKQWVGILADQSHAELVYDVMGRAVHVVSQRIGKPVRPSLEEHDFGIERLHTPKRYWIREMALKRRHPGSRQAEVQELVSQRLLQGLTRAADHYSLDCPSLDELGLFMVVTRHIGMPLSTTTGITKEYVTLVNAEVLWCVGFVRILVCWQPHLTRLWSHHPSAPWFNGIHCGTCL